MVNNNITYGDIRKAIKSVRGQAQWPAVRTRDTYETRILVVLQEMNVAIGTGQMVVDRDMNNSVKLFPTLHKVDEISKLISARHPANGKDFMNTIASLAKVSEQYAKEMGATTLQKYKHTMGLFGRVQKVRSADTVQFNDTWEDWGNIKKIAMVSRPDITDEALVMSLYVDNPPVRLNYGDVKMQSKSRLTHQDTRRVFASAWTTIDIKVDNFYNVDTGLMTLNKFKNERTSKPRIFMVDEYTKIIIDQRIATRGPTPWLLSQKRDKSKALGSGPLGRLIAAAFILYSNKAGIPLVNAKIGVDLLRSSFVVLHYSNPEMTGQEKLELADAMSSSMDAHALVYNRVMALEIVLACPNCHRMIRSTGGGTAVIVDT
jgi:hypothetical protein